jgi:hypothetical protein
VRAETRLRGVSTRGVRTPRIRFSGGGGGRGRRGGGGSGRRCRGPSASLRTGSGRRLSRGLSSSPTTHGGEPVVGGRDAIRDIPPISAVVMQSKPEVRGQAHHPALQQILARQVAYCPPSLKAGWERGVPDRLAIRAGQLPMADRPASLETVFSTRCPLFQEEHSIGAARLRGPAWSPLSHIGQLPAALL